ncbi:unnamed protein product [Darwinula stevensoni]|uniref:Uncharacterized protein n=1 Tax=Darwinula stevensoni TaxID=69355 RepID=A0A7R9A458_9CRUS|nr:unnamed protein product [Darwinula stevensoni]CAG0892992.1 unnamed protein product [Darwinula stevensoni]
MTSNNNISKVPKGFLMDFEKLESFGWTDCNLGPTLRYGSLEFHSEALRGIYLYGDSISSLEPYAITGLMVDTKIDFRFNEFSELPEVPFRPMIEVLSQEQGYIDMAVNPIECGCSMAWLVRNPAFLRAVHGGQCTDGTFFEDLEPEAFQDCIEMPPPFSGDFSDSIASDRILDIHVYP